MHNAMWGQERRRPYSLRSGVAMALCARSSCGAMRTTPLPRPAPRVQGGGAAVAAGGAAAHAATAGGQAGVTQDAV